jgi:hypothetical protein
MDADGIGDFLGEAVLNVGNNNLDLTKYSSDDTLLLTSTTLPLHDPLSNAVLSDIPSYLPKDRTMMHKCRPAKRKIPLPVQRKTQAEQMIKDAVEDVESSSSVIQLCLLVIIL